MNINNYLQNKIDEYGQENVNILIDLYGAISNERLKIIFSKIHYEINYLFRHLNERLLNGHYTAQESRLLIYWIEQIQEIQSNLRKTNMEFHIDKYYKGILEKCEEFLQKSFGSKIPEDFKKIILTLIEPIFIVKNSITLTNVNKKSVYPIKLIGEGSYAQVFKYRDEYYNKNFVIKRAKIGLTEKEYKRFNIEFQEMKKLNSPYVVEVYRFDEEKREYTMEYVDETIKDFICNNNSNLSKTNRQNIVFQILKAFKYIHTQGLLHRDISFTNVLIKKYEGLNVVKVSDFGLVKIEENNLTSIDSEIKGSLNDPNLELYGFGNYNIFHETYALTRLVYFVMSGKVRVEKFDSKSFEKFVRKGISANLDSRYKDVDELIIAFKKYLSI